MIYQLYPNNNKISPPLSDLYEPLCLDCLGSEYIPQLKMEYSGMLYIWKNKIFKDNWIGFTSYRQLDKSPFVLDHKNKDIILPLLDKYDILSWLFVSFDMSISQQAERCHKNINQYLIYLFMHHFNEPIPSLYFTERSGCFANYWIMSIENFIQFMEWSYPKVLTIVKLSKTMKYLKLDTHENNSGFIIERLYNIWYMRYNKKIYPLFSKKLCYDT